MSERRKATERSYIICEQYTKAIHKQVLIYDLNKRERKIYLPCVIRQYEQKDEKKVSFLNVSVKQLCLNVARCTERTHFRVAETFERICKPIGVPFSPSKIRYIMP